MNVADIIGSGWAITPEMFAEVQAIYARHARCERIDLAALEQRSGKKLANQRDDLRVQNGVAVVELQGVLAKRMNLFMDISGGTSTQIAASQIDAAAADSSVHTILLHIDSPGGTVDGTQQLADRVYAARGRKKVIALADGSMMSAAYWIGSAASHVFISSDTTLTGSIGVLATHIDVSRREEMLGIKTTEITAGKYKRIASDYATLSKEGREYLQAHVDALYSVFVDAVARNRGRASDAVLASMADGRTFVGRQAVTAGLVDGVASFNQLLAAGRDYQGASDMPLAKGEHDVDDPETVARKAREYEAEQKALGITVSGAAAVDHVLGTRLNDNSPLAIAERAQAYKAQQKQLGIEVSDIAAVDHVIRQVR